MVLTVLKTVQVPHLHFIDKFVDALSSLCNDGRPMVLTVRKPVEIQQVPILDKVLDMPVCCSTTGAHVLDCAEARRDSTVAVLDMTVLVQQRSPTTRTVASSVFPTSTAPPRCQSRSVVAVHRQIRRHPCLGAGAVPQGPDDDVDATIAVHRQGGRFSCRAVVLVPQLMAVEKTVEIPQLQIVEKNR